jgi:two-component system OmpR family sensor kinase
VHRLSLRARLVLGVFALAAVALLAANAATYLSLRSFLLDRVDSSLEAGHAQVEQQALGPGGGGGDVGRRRDADHGATPPAQGIDWYEVRSLSGAVLKSGFLVGGGSAPKLPARISPPTGIDRADPAHERESYFTVPAANGSGSYRVRVSIDPHYPDRLLAIASFLGGESDTLRRLVLIELLVTLAALGGISGIGFWVVRLGLRPLRAIEATAATIAGGDLTGRVERAERRTEVGRLGLSLNTMLGQVEAAFRAREHSEARLRQFIADASHELRTPLAAVRAYAELFERGAASRPEDLARSMSGITREAERMSVLVEELLLLAHLDEGRPLQREQLDLGQLASEAADTARVVEPARPITVSVERAPVVGDPTQLRQVIDNLLSNVRAHTPPETPVTVSVQRVGGRVELSVIDRGPGLTEAQAAKVFERFYRVDPSRARASGGAGLGLSIVAAVAEAHGGSARAQPARSGGATFIVTLPSVAA